ncbi:hypothetical protein PR202_ga21156 [Eleusine coracana subsp. coracana]|uniref:Uncharacterized protein n=1 Tax=Eleusine coracana subsp. coracana TaxID=191504 RepID=A0AAV5D0V5_ELECO|nr:hypothetical protein PR202_ga21156 [Eleusine coracana subsp. coracana]
MEAPELLQAQFELRNITFSYLKSMALQCTVDHGIPNTIYLHGDAASLSDLSNAIYCHGGAGSLSLTFLAIKPLPEHRRTFLPRLMRFLTATGSSLLILPPLEKPCTTLPATPYQVPRHGGHAPVRLV